MNTGETICDYHNGLNPSCPMCITQNAMAEAVLLLEVAALRNKLCEAINIARKGKYSAGDFVAVGQRLDALEDYLNKTK